MPPSLLRYSADWIIWVAILETNRGRSEITSLKFKWTRKRIERKGKSIDETLYNGAEKIGIEGG